MQPYQFLIANVRNGVATMTVGVRGLSRGGNVESDNIQLIGSSMPTSVNAGDGKVKYFSLELASEDASGVVAVVVRDTKGWPSPVLIGVKRDGEKIEVLMHESFVPERGRLGQIYEDGRITVRVGEVIYTNKYPEKCDEPPHPEFRLVDADNLCRYLAGTINAEQLEEASLGHVQAISQTKYTQDMEKAVKKLSDEGLNKDVEIAELRARVAESDESRQELIETLQESKKLLAAVVAINKAAAVLREETIGEDRKFFLRGPVEKFIKTYNNEFIELISASRLKRLM